ncbi:cytochrome P450 4F12-like [Ruditapes philippinarum]|uniref:cytochrome P450 4F12-like n=1 Tax=Ruditapes philippinarum TaxID=129788 RepID=UPI00295B3F22|nr:cytochrome P450 4F12-like [Ruditapes philippinarum]
MDVLIKTAFLGVFVFIFWKLGSFLLNYIKLCVKLRNVPQKKAHWLAGHAKEVKDSVTYFKYADDLMKEGNKIYCIWNGPFPLVGVCHPETFQQLNKQALNKSREIDGPYRLIEPWVGEGLLVSGSQKWERNRRLLTPAFHFDILNGYVTVMNDVADIFLNKIYESSQKNGSVDVCLYVCRATLDNMLRCSLSYDGSMQENVEHTYVKAVQKLATIIWHRMTSAPLLFDFVFNLSPSGRDHNKLVKEVHKFTGEIIAKRQKLLADQPDLTKLKRRLDFLDILLTAKDEQGRGLSPQEIQNEVDTFTFEGHDTTASAISYAIYALGQYPEIQEKVYQDVINVADDVDEITQNEMNQFKYLPQFIKEVMRFYSTVPLISRQSSKEVVLDGKTVPPNIRIDINLRAILHNPEIWKCPEVFDPCRFNTERRDSNEIYGFIPFSAGSRNCIGQVFANNEIKIVLAKLVKRYEVLPVKGHKHELLPDIVMRSFTGLPVTLKSR